MSFEVFYAPMTGLGTCEFGARGEGGVWGRMIFCTYVRSFFLAQRAGQGEVLSVFCAMIPAKTPPAYLAGKGSRPHELAPERLAKMWPRSQVPVALRPFAGTPGGISRDLRTACNALRSRELSGRRFLLIPWC